MTKTKSICPVCGTIHHPKPSQIEKGWGVFCSRKCANEAQKVPIEQRFFDKVTKTDTCWVWNGAKHSGFGYGVIWTSSRKRLRTAHRVSWEIHNGPIPDGLDVLHKCDNPPCIRPDHLFLGTRQDNNDDRNAKGRTVIPPQESGKRGGALKSGVLSMTKGAIRKRKYRTK